MRCIGNEKGIALVTALMFTVLALVISMSLLYMVTAGIRTSGALKRYRSVTDATYGGTQIMVKDIVSTAFAFKDYSAAHPGTSFSTYMSNSMGSLSTPIFDPCLKQHMTLPRTQWTGGCAANNLDPKTSPTDVKFQLNAASGAPYAVYAKIVDTMERKFVVYDSGAAKTVVMAGNSDTSSIVLEGGSTTDGAGVTVPQYPFVYRIEVQGEKATNAAERSNISVQYAY